MTQIAAPDFVKPRHFVSINSGWGFYIYIYLSLSLSSPGAWEKKALYSHFWQLKLLKGAYHVLLDAEEIRARLRIEVLKKLIDQLPFDERFR